MVEGGGFEPPKAEPSDLQSDPFGHSGTPPKNEAAHSALAPPPCQHEAANKMEAVRNPLKHLKHSLRRAYYNIIIQLDNKNLLPLRNS